MNDNTELEPEVVEAIKRGRKIEAIKKLRKLRGIDLKESKELVDAYLASHQTTIRSIQKADSGFRPLIIILIVIAGYFIYKQFTN